MKSSAVTEEILQRQHLNATLESFLSLPYWTPAMGALLVCGVAPVPSSTQIPDSATSLRDSATPAGQRDLLDARKVLQRWAEWYTDEEEPQDTSIFAVELSPIEFLVWCEEDYENRAEWSKPSWLAYWRTFLEMSANGSAPSPAPARLVNRAANLEGMASALAPHVPPISSVLDIGEQSSPSDSHVPGVSAQRYRELMARAIESGKHPIAGSIILALHRADNPRSAVSVWRQLCSMAKTGKQQDLVWVDGADEETIKIPLGKGDTRPYKYEALETFLRRKRHDLGLE